MAEPVHADGVFYGIGALAVHDPFTASWWQAASRGVLLLQHCPSCGAHQHYPRPFCLRCGSDELRDVAASGAGVVHSVTVVRFAVHDELPPPSCLALVELAEGPCLLSTVGAGARIGDAVTVTWLVRQGLPVHHFTSAAASL